MVLIIREHIANIPCLHVVKADYKNDMLPLVMFIHGFTSAKEHNLHFGYLLAEAGYRVILPDALYHGERPNELTEQQLNFSFWNIVLQTIEEIKQIKDALVQQNLVDEQRIGLAGTSMGGIVTFGALTQYHWIKAAVSLMGSPCYQKFFDLQLEFAQKRGFHIPLSDVELKKTRETLARYDLSLQPEKLNGRPLLLWHGKQDDVVPYEHTYQFYKQIQSSHEPLKFISDEKAGHKVTREAFLETVQWFIRHL
jgi:dipeptidyl aminopeptidase/acylaminoacyl peptidase